MLSRGTAKYHFRQMRTARARPRVGSWRFLQAGGGGPPVHRVEDASMDSERFDGLVRSFGQTWSRRQTLRGLAGAGALLALFAAKAGEEATAGDKPVGRLQDRTPQRNRQQRNKKNNNNKTSDGGGGDQLG